MLKISVVESRSKRRLILEGKLSSDLIQKIFLPAFANGYLSWPTRANCWPSSRRTPQRPSSGRCVNILSGVTLK